MPGYIWKPQALRLSFLNPTCRGLPWDVRCVARLHSDIGWRILDSDSLLEHLRCSHFVSVPCVLQKGRDPVVHTDLPTWSDVPTRRAHQMPPSPSGRPSSHAPVMGYGFPLSCLRSLPLCSNGVRFSNVHHIYTVIRF